MCKIFLQRWRPLTKSMRFLSMKRINAKLTCLRWLHQATMHHQSYVEQTLESTVSFTTYIDITCILVSCFIWFSSVRWLFWDVQWSWIQLSRHWFDSDSLLDNQGIQTIRKTKLSSTYWHCWKIFRLLNMIVITTIWHRMDALNTFGEWLTILWRHTILMEANI